MLTRVALVLLVSILTLEVSHISSYKTLEELQKSYSKAKDAQRSAADGLVGRAVDFFYSNKTVMSLVAQQLWDIGSHAIDAIVDVKDGSAQQRMLSKNVIDATTFFKQTREQYEYGISPDYLKDFQERNTVTANMRLVGGTTVVLIIIIEIGAQKTYNAKVEKPPSRDYRPDKWLTSTATDMWFGKQTLAEIVGRDLKEMVKRTIRVGRATRNATRHILKYKKMNGTMNSAPKELISQILQSMRKNNSQF